MRKINRIIKRIYSAVFSRLVLTGLLILSQAVWMAFLFLRLTDYIRWINGLYIAFSVIMCLLLIRVDSIEPEFKISWMALFLLMPVQGGILYLLWGNKRPAFRLRRKLDRAAARIHPLLTQEPEPAQRLKQNDSRGALTARYLSRQGHYPGFSDTEVKYYPLGDDMFADMLPALESAEHFIFIEYFIIGLGTMWGQIHEILRRKAAQGVDVRVIYDDVGSVSVLPMGYWSKLEEEGIHSLPFNPFVPVLNLVMNNRDHRKIMVIDGYIAFSGGVNIADEYINKLERFGHWRDTAIRLRGDAAWSFTIMFLEFWNANRPTDREFEHFKPERHRPAPFVADGLVQPFSDSPVDRENVSQNVYLELINQARYSLFITTPYLILSNELLTALCLAAKRGVDVRIYTPGIPDKKMTYQLTRSYFPPLLQAGVRIFSYTPGFLHGKTWLCDDRIAAVGTVNLDYRSLYLHFECSTLLYGCRALADIRADMIELESHCRAITLNECRNSFFGTLLSAVLRTMAPLF